MDERKYWYNTLNTSDKSLITNTSGLLYFLTAKGEFVQMPTGTFLCGIWMLSPCLLGSPPGTSFQRHAGQVNWKHLLPCGMNVIAKAFVCMYVHYPCDRVVTCPWCTLHLAEYVLGKTPVPRAFMLMGHHSIQTSAVWWALKKCY